MDTLMLLILNDFSAEVRKAFEQIEHNGFYLDGYDIQAENGNLKINIFYNGVMKKILILKNAEYSVDISEIEIYSENVNIRKENGKYFLDADYYDYAEDGEKRNDKLTISFTDAEIECRIHKPNLINFGLKPWNNLFTLAWEIANKYDIFPDCCNERETAFIPLLTELYRLDHLSDNQRFPLLKELFIKHGFSEAAKRLEKIETEADERLRIKRTDRFAEQLNNAKYENVWRELFDKIMESQEGYPPENAPDEKMLLMRERINALMAENGYKGAYPEYIKTELKGKKRHAFYLYFGERYIDDLTRIKCFCGTRELKENEDIGDIYSCMFRDKTKRVCAELSSDLFDENNEIRQDIDNYVKIAIKKAQQEKLTKEEKKAVFTNDGVSVSLPEALITGLLTAIIALIIAIPLFILIGGLISFILFGADGVKDMLHEIPWFKMSAIIFGAVWVIMTVYMLLPFRKYY